MTPRVPRYSMEEFARRGKEIYARVVRPTLSQDDIGKLVMIDIESEDFEVDTNEFAALERSSRGCSGSPTSKPDAPARVFVSWLPTLACAF